MQTNTPLPVAPVVRRFADLGEMIRHYMGPLSGRDFANMVGVDANAIARAARGLPMPDEAAEQIVKYYQMNHRLRTEFYEHICRARAQGHKSIAAFMAYVQRIEANLDSIEESMVTIALLIPKSGPVSDHALKKLREIAGAIIERNHASPQR